MGALFEELDYQVTPIGPLSLRRRLEMRLGVDVVEVKLGDEHLMSDLFTQSERALARLGLAELAGTSLEVAVGGLGLGYTAQAVLEDARVRSVIVVEFLAPVIEWHDAGILPVGRALTTDPRCRLVEGDFFALAGGAAGLDPCTPHRRFDAILVDIDHSPDAWLDARSRGFYQTAGLRAVARHLRPGGIFGLWSDDPPEPRFLARLEAAFPQAWTQEVRFASAYEDREIVQTVYLARAASHD